MLISNLILPLTRSIVKSRTLTATLMPRGIIRYSSRASTEWLRKVPKLRSKPPLDLNAKVQRQQRKRRQREKTGPRCVILARKPVQRPGLSESAQTSPLSTKSTRRTPKTPGLTSPAFSLERNLVQVTLVEAPGLEPGSEKGPSEASTSVAYILFVGPRAPAGGIPRPQSVGDPRQLTDITCRASRF